MIRPGGEGGPSADACSRQCHEPLPRGHLRRHLRQCEGCAAFRGDVRDQRTAYLRPIRLAPALHAHKDPLRGTDDDRHCHRRLWRPVRPRPEGARQYGRYFEEFEVGAVYKHSPAKTVTEADDHLFCLITMNHHPLHINDVYAAQSQQGRNVVVGPLVYSLMLRLSVGDSPARRSPNLAIEELSIRRRSSHGDTLYAESEVLEVYAVAVEATPGG